MKLIILGILMILANLGIGIWCLHSGQMTGLVNLAIAGWIVYQMARR